MAIVHAVTEGREGTRGGRGKAALHVSRLFEELPGDMDCEALKTNLKMLWLKDGYRLFYWDRVGSAAGLVDPREWCQGGGHL